MEYIQVTRENIENEHICCAISNNKDIQVSSKKAWMEKCFDDGLTFIKSAERGKCFIEYIPAKNAWVPNEQASYDYPPMVMFNGVLYSAAGYSGTKDRLTLVGEIEIAMSAISRRRILQGRPDGLATETLNEKSSPAEEETLPPGGTALYVRKCYFPPCAATAFFISL